MSIVLSIRKQLTVREVLNNIPSVLPEQNESDPEQNNQRPKLCSFRTTNSTYKTQKENETYWE
jgi:hypothetical protein